nr:MAG TPA: Putative zinc- or iron-chelating domain [Bacteriophage sp.]
MKSASLEQMLADMNSGVYDLTCNGECTQCGNCCSNLLPMTEYEIATIHKYIKEYHIKEHRHNYPTATPTMDMTCPFLNDDKPKEKCEIYSVRPRICREFICCPSKRPPINDLSYKLKCRVVDVRKEFYG